MAKKRKKVILGMSGGIDSAVAAALLKKRGFDVVCLFMHFRKESARKISDFEDAQKIAKILNIPICESDVSKEFKEEVMDYFLREIKSGKTPNPCIVCNKKIKFNILFRKMLEMEADFVATGHYAHIKKTNGKYHLAAARDKEKDQTYFLYNLSQKEMEKIIFPLGMHKKSEIRRMAKRLKLPVFEKGESQDICFIEGKNPNGFIKRSIKLSPGEIILSDGSKIGMHDGLELYTIGQRKGINIGGNGPYYVVDRNFKNSQLVVANDKNDPAILRKSMLVGDVNWIAEKPEMPAEIKVKIRYRHPLVRGIIRTSKRQNVKTLASLELRQSGSKRQMVEFEFEKPQRAVTPGQSAVFYSDKKEVLGGGIIK